MLGILQAEARIAARRAARAEARDVRVREIERQQKEEEEKERNELGSDIKVSRSEVTSKGHHYT